MTSWSRHHLPSEVTYFTWLDGESKVLNNLSVKKPLEHKLDSVT